MFQIGFGMRNVGFLGLFRGHIGSNIGLGGGNRGFLTLDVCALLDVLNAGDFLALSDFVAFFYIEMRDAAKGGSPEVDVGLWLDLSRPAYRRDEVFPDSFPVITLV